MCSSTLLPCPLCCSPYFSSVDLLRTSLIDVTNRPLNCPICQDILIGLDKLTIHLFGHTIMTTTTSIQLNTSSPSPSATIANTISSITINNHDTVANNTSSSPSTTTAQTTTILTTSTSNNDSGDSVADNIKKCKKNKSGQNRLKNKDFSQNFEPECQICGSTFRSFELYQMHMNFVHEITINPRKYNVHVNNDDIVNTNNNCDRYRCHLCSKFFKMRGSLRVHLRVVHGSNSTYINYNNQENMNVSDVIDNQDNEDIVNYSNQCLVKSEQPINDHKLETQSVIGTPSDSNTSQNTLSSIVSKVIMINDVQEDESKLANTMLDVKLWDCDICAKSFTTKYFLKKHKRLHTGEMPYTCLICSKTFTFQQTYHKHLLYHSDDKPHMCSVCGRAFKELSTLHNHERIHSGEKPYKCETCDKCFRQRVSYLVHRRIHTGVMPYKCTACDKSFRYKVSQRSHKCSAEPPGTVIRQPGHLLQKLIENSAINKVEEQYENSSDTKKSVTDDYNWNKNNDNNNNLNGDYLQQTLDEFIQESWNKIEIDNKSNDIYQYHDNDECISRKDIDLQIPSPSEKLQGLCLSASSPATNDVLNYDENTTSLPTFESMAEDSIKLFLYNNDIL